jgi:hypothetical protein
VRQIQFRCDTRSHGHRPVSSRRDDPIEIERSSEPFNCGLVLGRDNAPAIGKREPGGARVSISDRRPDALTAGSLKQAELSRARA